MKNIRLITASLFVLAFLSISAFAQTAAQTGKVFVIDTYAFADEKEGITKFVNASKQIDTEFKPRVQELQTMYDKMQSMAKEAQKLKTDYENAGAKSPIKPDTIQAKLDELQKMDIDFKRKQEDLKTSIDKRGQALLNPIRSDIFKVMQDFAKQKGYPIILDLAKMDEANIILAIGDDKVNVTKEFITFYNARPATAANATR